MPGIQYWHEVNDSDDEEEDQTIKYRDDTCPVFDRGKVSLWSFSGWDHELNFND